MTTVTNKNNGIKAQQVTKNIVHAAITCNIER